VNQSGGFVFTEDLGTVRSHSKREREGHWVKKKEKKEVGRGESVGGAENSIHSMEGSQLLERKPATLVGCCPHQGR